MKSMLTFALLSIVCCLAVLWAGGRAMADNPPSPGAGQDCAAAEVTLAPVSVFTPSRQRIIELSGWLSGRKPVAVTRQGRYAKVVIRRSWKNTDNDGSYVDIYPGWRNTGGKTDTATVELDNGDTIDIAYEVRDLLPAGTKRYLDASRATNGDGSGSSPWNNWASAIAGVREGDVLVVSAKAGTRSLGGHEIPNCVYPVDGDSGGPSSSVDNVTIVADPVDTAAGRRPVIQNNATEFAGFLHKAKPNGMWVLYKDLGTEGTVWKSVQSFSAPAHSYAAMYKAINGRWIKLYSLRNIDGAKTQSRLSQLTDTTYPRFRGKNYGTYWGPSISYEPDGHYYIRLQPPAKRTIFDPNETADLPYPAWDWTGNYASSMDPNNVDIVIVSGEDWVNKNYLLDLTNRKGWTLKNLDFILGNIGIWAPGDVDDLSFFGVTMKGGTTMDFLDEEWDVPYIWAYVYTDALNGIAPTRPEGFLFDHCEIWGGLPPWASWLEGKGAFGAAPFAYRGDMISVTALKATYRHSIIDGWWSAAWYCSPPLWGDRYRQVSIHHSLVRHFGSDGGFVGPTSGNWVFNRNLLIDFVPWGFSISAIASGDHAEIGLNLMIALTTFIGDYGGAPRQSKYVNTAQGCNHVAPVTPAGGRSVLHGQPYHVPPEWLYNNTGVGTNHGHRTNAYSGSGSHIGPTSFAPSETGLGNQVFNSVGVVVPSPYAWPAGVHTIANRYVTQSGVASRYDHNIIWRTPATYPTGGAFPSNLNCDGLLFLQHDSEDNNTCYEDSGAGWDQFRSDTGLETHGLRADPEFAIPPRWPATSPYRAGGAYDLANYMLSATSPARTGGKSWLSDGFVDYDGNAGSTWRNANGFRGALDPNIPILEQEIGPLGPVPSEVW